MTAPDDRPATPSSASIRGRPSQRPSGVVLEGLITAGVDQARAGGPDAIILREATRNVGVSPNAAYRYFAGHDALLAAVAWEAMVMLSTRMETDVAAVAFRRASATGARARLQAIGHAYLRFAADEPGLFQTAFAGPAHTHTREHAVLGHSVLRTPLQILDDALDELVEAGVLSRARRRHATWLAWSTVHGLAVLRLTGTIPEGHSQAALDNAVAAFIERGL